MRDAISFDEVNPTAVEALARVLEERFEQIIESTLTPLREGDRAILVDVAEQALASRSEVMRPALLRGFDGDWTDYKTFMLHQARAYVSAGVPFARWLEAPAAFADAIAAQLVSVLGTDAPQFHDAMRAVRRLTIGSIGVFGSEFIAAAESNLRSSRARMAAILEAGFDGVVTVDDCGTICELNGAAERLFGRVAAADTVGRSLSELVAPIENRDRSWPATMLSIEPGPARRFDARAHAADGAELHVEVAVARVDHAGPATFACAIRDVSEARRADAELEARRTDAVSTATRLARSEAALRALAVRREAERENERTRMAREIHDDLGQDLTALKLHVERLTSDALLLGGSAAALAPRLATLAEDIGATMTSVRRIATELRPSSLDDLGLVAAIRAHATAFANRTGMEVALDLSADWADDQGERATALFRITQELLTNVARHARARNVRVQLGSTVEGTALVVEDDGVGISDAAVADVLSLGLLGIRERLAPLGGQLSIQRGNERGTVAVARLPRAQVRL